ncbi:hypothetical protein I4U23_001434 [Adineta vaga]|nr:hypothetical protein I4U23_001434 [Adineta vaga]
MIPRSYAIDDISVTSCAYPPAKIRDDNTGLLHFSCDFDNLTLCGMETGDRFMKPMYNFTIKTGETVPDRSLGPLLDHTTNSSAGGFSYWKRQLPFTSGDLGYLFTAYPMVSNLGMCIRFAYYVKSSVKDKNGTMLGVTTGGCFGTTLWSILLDDSQGWQVVNLLAPNVVCMETYYLSVYQKTPVAVAVAIDDFIIDQCNTFTTTTTVTSTTTTTITSPSTTTSTTPATTTVTSTTTSSTIHTTTTTSGSTISTTTTTTTTTTSKSNARRVFCSNRFQTNTAILKCDFETSCNDFAIDSNWGLTDGAHPLPTNHDHTLNTSAGHYLFYSPQSQPPFYNVEAEIKTKEWVQLPLDRAVCFQMWYYTPRIDFPFTVQLVQGDDEQLTRIVASIPGKDPSTNDWTLVKIRLPAEKFKLFIRSNVSVKPLAFDDISIDYCDEPRPEPPKTLLACDFESNCVNEFVSLSDYPYPWLIKKASEAIVEETKAPTFDFTYGNQSGHYAFVANSKLIEQGNVGYLATRTQFDITANESFCLNFHYYAFGVEYYSYLKVYARYLDPFETVQQIWPPTFREYIYTNAKWTWSVINLPLGYYSLWFRVDTLKAYPRSFAIDDLSVTCAYPPITFPYDGMLLSFECNFDNSSMCGMQNGDRYTTPTYNFTIETSETIPDRTLGPFHDHTTNSSTGGFVYWNRQLPFMAGNSGVVLPPKMVEFNLGMCVRYAYYVKSSVENQNGTVVSVWTGLCDSQSIWQRKLDDSKGWQTIVIPVPKIVCEGTIYFYVHQLVNVPVSVAFDDIEIGPCDILDPTTTTTTTTTSTTSTTTVTTTTTTDTTTTISSTTTTTPTTTTITITESTSTSTRSNARRVLFSNEFILIVFCILLKFF